MFRDKDFKEEYQEMITESPIKNLWKQLYYGMEKNKNIFWFVNISKYHHREMGLMSSV